jgi:hypothetical protein
MGVNRWEDVFCKEVRLPYVRWEYVCEEVERSIEAIQDKDASYFSNKLPPSEHWRAYKEFKEGVAFLDIETTGLLPDRSYITMVGLFDGKKYRAFIHGINIDEVVDVLPKFKMIITFNGRRFDVPFLLKKFPEIEIRCLHTDLLYYTRRLGLRGGLKNIER